MDKAVDIFACAALPCAVAISKTNGTPIVQVFMWFIYGNLYQVYVLL
jgi:hypothetical protein